MKRLLAACAMAFAALIHQADAQSLLRIGLREDPDILDPTLGRTFVGRIVFAGLCDKLFDIDENLRIVPQLATGFTWSADNRQVTITLRDGVTFHDGERFDAEAAKFSLDRHRTMQGSIRRGELATVTNVEVVDRLTLRLTLSTPFSPLIAQLTDRAGMMVSPRAAQAAGENFGRAPVCAGPMRFVERVAQDHITLERFANYWNRDAIHFDRVEYRIIYDGTVRLANLQAGSIELAETINASDIAAVRRNPALRLAVVDELGYQGIMINVGNGARAASPIGSNPRLREAFELSLDRAVINQVVFGGEFRPGNQWVPPSSPYFQQGFPIPARDVARARALVAAAGLTNPVIELTVANNPEQRQTGEIIQAMAREAGIEVRVRAMEFASALQATNRGDFEAFLFGWSGRADPDGNSYSFIRGGAPNNDGRYANAEVDRLFDEARGINDAAARNRLYEQVTRIVLADRPFIFLYHRRNLVAHAARLQGFQPNPDGIIRLQGVRLAGN